MAVRWEGSSGRGGKKKDPSRRSCLSHSTGVLGVSGFAWLRDKLFGGGSFWHVPFCVPSTFAQQHGWVGLARHKGTALAIAALRSVIVRACANACRLPTAACFTLCTCTGLLGLSLVLLGRLRLASVVQYLPMPVIGGYLAFIGYFCGQAGLAFASGVRRDMRSGRTETPETRASCRWTCRKLEKHCRGERERDQSINRERNTGKRKFRKRCRGATG